MYQVACNGPGEPPSSTCTGTNEFLPHSLGLGSQSTGIFLLQVWAFLRPCAPSLPWERCQMQVMPCQDAPKALWEVWICMGGVGGTHGSGVWWWEVGHCKSSLLPRLSLAAPAHLPPTAQHPGLDQEEEQQGISNTFLLLSFITRFNIWEKQSTPCDRPLPRAQPPAALGCDS